MIKLHVASGDRLFELFPAKVCVEVCVVAKLNARFFGKQVRAVAGEQNMLCPLHHQARELDRILDVSDKSYRAGPQIRTVHYRGVHLVLAFVREDRAPSSVKERAILKRGDRSFHGIQCGTSSVEYRPARLECVFETRPVFRFKLGGHSGAKYRAGPAVDSQCNVAHDVILPHGREDAEDHSAKRGLSIAVHL